jgi:hypothetical protein
MLESRTKAEDILMLSQFNECLPLRVQRLIPTAEYGIPLAVTQNAEIGVQR